MQQNEKEQEPVQHLVYKLPSETSLEATGTLELSSKDLVRHLIDMGKRVVNSENGGHLPENVNAACRCAMAAHQLISLAYRMKSDRIKRHFSEEN